MTETVLSVWDMKCPKCGDDSRLDVTAMISVRVTVDGTDLDELQNHDHEWDEKSACGCCQCGHAGVVADFKVQEKAGGKKLFKLEIT